jgi:hypothetical protein
VKVGDRVRMTQKLKDAFIANGCRSHVREFGNCVGVIVGRSDDCEPVSWDVRWIPSKLRYGYLEEFLELAE